MVLAWSVTEVIRYPFYALSLLGINSNLLLWLRYTTFYVLYPLGASSEAFLILATLPQGFIPSYTPAFAPKPLENWSLDQYVRGGLFLIWWPGKTPLQSAVGFAYGRDIPGLYAMYTYMIGQRKKVLSSPKQKTQ